MITKIEIIDKKKFPSFEEYKKRMNNVYFNCFEQLEEYYKKLTVNISNPQQTILMDESEQGLDIRNLEWFYNMIIDLSKNNQLILVVHNPILIYKFEKLGANIIEFTKGYVKKVIRFMNECDKK